MNTELEFLQVIRSDLDNPVPRLIFADWLDELGDPRGEFIRVQCELESKQLSPLKRDWLRQREEELLHEFQPEWLEPIRSRGLSSARWIFQRGLVEGVQIDAREFAERGELFHQAFPLLHRLSLRNLVPRDVEGVAASESLSRFSELHLASRPRPFVFGGSFAPDPQNYLDGADIKRLLRSPYLFNIRCLDLTEAQFVDSAIRGVLACPNLRLDTFRLSHEPLDMEWIRAFAGSSSMQELRELELAAAKFDSNQLFVLACSSLLEHLETLDLRQNRFCSERNMVSLTALGRFTKLKHLNLKACGLENIGLETISKTPLWGQLETLVLTNNQIGDPGVIEMAQAEPPPKPRALELSRNRIGDAGLMALARSPALLGFSELTLNHNRIEDEGILHLANTKYGGQLRGLHLRGNAGITDRGGVALATATLPELETLDLAGTKVGDDTLLALIDACPGRLRLLDLAQTRITESAVLRLIESDLFDSLELLDIRVNPISEDCVTAIQERFANRILISRNR